jgi:hypothetical protein
MARKRRTFTSEFKAEVVLQLISGEKSMAEVGGFKYRLGTHNLRAEISNLFYVVDRLFNVFLEIGGARHLDQVKGYVFIHVHFLLMD